MFLETEDPLDLTRIFNDDVEAVIWKRTPARAVLDAIESFDPENFHMTPQRLQAEAKMVDRIGFDEDQIMIFDGEQNSLRALKPLWQDRQRIVKSLQSVFHTAFYTNAMQVQPPARRRIDSCFHQDRTFSEKNRTNPDDNNRLIALVAHKNTGTILLPRKDSGPANDDKPGGRSIFANPTDITRQFQAQTHDVVLIRTGQNGTVHRAPFVAEGDRWLSLFFGKSCAEIQMNMDLYSKKKGAKPSVV